MGRSVTCTYFLVAIYWFCRNKALPKLLWSSWQLRGSGPRQSAAAI